METLGQAIRKARIDRRMAQKELREKVGVSQKQMSAIELDKAIPRWDTVVKIAKALGLKLDDLATTSAAPNGHREPAAPPRRRQGAAAAASSKLSNHAAKAEQSHS